MTNLSIKFDDDYYINSLIGSILYYKKEHDIFSPKTIVAEINIIAYSIIHFVALVTLIVIYLPFNLTIIQI